MPDDGSALVQQKLMYRDLSPLRIGLFSIGLDAYWPQFPGLKEKLLTYNQQIARRLGRNGVEVVNLELVDSPRKPYRPGIASARQMSTSYSST